MKSQKRKIYIDYKNLPKSLQKIVEEAFKINHNALSFLQLLEDAKRLITPHRASIINYLHKHPLYDGVEYKDVALFYTKQQVCVPSFAAVMSKVKNSLPRTIVTKLENTYMKMIEKGETIVVVKEKGHTNKQLRCSNSRR